MTTAWAEPLRVATYHSDLTRRGPGLLLRDILSGKDPQVKAVIAVIAHARPDVLLLTGFDTDLDMVALRVLASRLEEAGHTFPHLLSPVQNAGLMTALDLDGDGKFGTPEDAQGYGRFAGARSKALLSRYPLTLEQDHSAFLWADLPNGRMPDARPDVRKTQRLSSTAHWVVRVDLPGGVSLRLLTWAATPPMFGTEDRNLRRNHDETDFWIAMLDRKLALPHPAGPFVVLGLANTDPEHGAGDKGAMVALLAHPSVQAGPKAATFHSERQSLQLSYVLPSQEIKVLDLGVIDPPPDVALAKAVATASRHRLVWADLDLP